MSTSENTPPTRDEMIHGEVVKGIIGMTVMWACAVIGVTALLHLPAAVTAVILAVTTGGCFGYAVMRRDAIRAAATRRIP